jgi:hypothetical protein
MKEPIFYIQVDTRDELPVEPENRRQAKKYDTELGPLEFEGKEDSEFGWYDNNYDRYPKPRYWYKEFPLEELMVGAVREYTEFKFQIDTGYLAADLPTEEEFVTEYLKLKNIISK